MTARWTIQNVAKAAGVSSRTLRHYDAIGLLPPTEIGDNGYRRYDEAALMRLQRILALRDLGFGLKKITAILAEEITERDALQDLERRLHHEQQRVQRQIASVQRTLSAMEQGVSPMTADMFDGFGHEEYKDEVEERWGADAYARSDAWWRSMAETDKATWKANLGELNAGWAQAAAAAVSPTSEIAQALAARHIAWLREMPTSVAIDDFPAYVRGLGEMYVHDPRFAANYGGEAGATLVRDALAAWLERHHP